MFSCPEYDSAIPRVRELEGGFILETTVDRFGFLNWGRAIEFEGGSIAPVPEFKETAGLVASCTNQDGFLCPATFLHHLPVRASHTLCLSDPYTIEELRRGAGAFIMHLLGYLFGIRLQFSDWWFDGRVPIRLQATHAIYISEATAQDFLSHSYKIWRAWKEKEQRLLTNALYMHCRAPMYRWDWERFTIEYMVLDACWKLAKLGHGVKDEGHAKRVDSLCRKFGIPSDGKLVEEIVRLRNDLFHEALWDGSQPCMGGSNAAFLQPYNLRRLNQRLIPALLGYETPYIRTNWWSIDTFSFDPPSRHGSK